MKKGIIFLLVLFFISGGILFGQYYDSGQDPASLRWRQTITEHFRVIYPEAFSAEALTYALRLEESYQKVSLLYPGISLRIPVIIHPYSMESNGYVTWAPRRMELYPLPGQEVLPADPVEQLTIHETTHVLQVASLNQGITRALTWFFGEQAYGVSVFFLPEWTLEGDAVYAETAFTESGRGRSNAFLQGAKALTCRPEKIYRYNKLLLGSYKDFTPNHYVFGYLMMNRLRDENPEAWLPVMKNVANFSAIHPVSQGLKKYASVSEEELYNNTFDTLLSLWNEQESNICSGLNDLNILKKEYTNYYSPFRIDNNRIISLQTSYSAPSRFVISDLSSGEEKVVNTTGYIYPYIFSCNGSTVAWAELHANPRWDNLDYSVIKTLDIQSGLITQLTYRTRYAAPDISPDGRTIAAVSTSPEMGYSLVFIGTATGETVMELPVPGNLIIERPAWTSDGRGVTMITLSEKGEGIRTYYPTGKKWVVNKPESLTEIHQAKIYNDTLFYLAQGDGSDNIYCIAPDSSEFRITGSCYGISGFSITDNELLAADYSSLGYKVSAIDKSSFTSYPANTSLSTFAIPVASVRSNEVNLSSIDSSAFITKPYNKITHLFNFHSWMPFYADIEAMKSDPTVISPGLMLLSQNHLSTLISTFGYEYSEGGHYLHSTLSWRGWYPIIDADVSYGGSQTVYKPSGVTLQPPQLLPSINLQVTSYLPLYYSYSKFRQIVMPVISIIYRNNLIYSSDNNNYDEGNTIVTGRLYLQNTFRMAYRDINPRWGQVLDIRYTYAPWDKELYGMSRYYRGILFFPGLTGNHSLVLRGGYENQAPVKYLLYYNRNPFPRGYDNYICEKLVSLSADYTMPLFYPDISLGSLFYLKRIRGSLFFDYAKGENTYDYNENTYVSGEKLFSSYGGELLADFNLLRFPHEISAGISGGYMPLAGKSFIEGTFSVNIYGNVLGRKR